MTIHIKKWGNSSAVRIPAQVLAAAGLSIEDAVTMREEGGKIVIEPIKKRKYDLKTLVDAITDENIHDPADFDLGPPVGNEFW